MNVSSCVRLTVMVVLLTNATAHAIAQTELIPQGQVVERIEALNDSSQSNDPEYQQIMARLRK